MRCGLDDFRIVLRLAGNRQHRIGKLIKRALTLRLRGLDHDGFFHDEWEVDGGRVEPVVEDALGHVARRHAVLPLLAGPRQHELVLAKTVVWEIEPAAQPRQQIVGIEDGGLGDLAQPVGSHGADVGIGPHQVAEVAVEGADLADGLRPLVVEAKALAIAFDDRHREKRRQVRLHTHRAGPGSTAAVGSSKRLVQVHVHDVKTLIARAGHTQNGVEIRPIQVQLAAGAVHDLLDVQDGFFKQPQRIRVSQHDRGHGAVHGLAQGADVHVTPGVGFYGDDLIADHGGGGGIGAVRGVRHDDLGTPFPTRFEVRADHQQPREFTVSTGRGLEGHAVHSADLRQQLLQFADQPQGALGPFGRRVRVQSRKARQARRVLMNLGVVLHRTGAKRIKAFVNAEVAVRQARVVTHHVELADLRQRGRLFAQLGGGDQLFQRCVRDVGVRIRGSDPPRDAEVEDDREVARPALSVVEGRHRKPSSSATSRSISAFVRCSVTQTSHASESSGYQRPSGAPPRMPAASRRRLTSSGASGVRTTNSLNVGASKASRNFGISRIASRA